MAAATTGTTRAPRRGPWLRLRQAVRSRGWGWLALQVVVTLLTAWLVWTLGTGLLRWVLWAANWDVVTANLRLFATGTYPTERLWRPVAALAMVAGLIGFSAPVWGSLARDLARAMTVALAGLLAIPLAAPLLHALGSPELSALAAAFRGGWPYVVMALVALGAGYGLGRWLAARAGPLARRRRLTLGLRLAWLASLPAVMLLLRGVGPMALVPVDRWGGLLLTLVLAIVAIAASFPLGVLLALGRRSPLPVVKATCVCYIELVRGVPLVTLLFIASIMLPLVLPDGIRPVSVVRALAGLTLFSAAYMAEDVRGGLAAVDRGQYDAARAMGLGTVATYRLIVLPQALRPVIPAIVGQLISLFKDTSLVIILGLRELLGIAQAVVNQPEFLGLYRETLIFIAVLYFLFSTQMSRSSRRLERELRVGRA